MFMMVFLYHKVRKTVRSGSVGFREMRELPVSW